MMIAICDLPKERREREPRICVDRGGGSSSATWTTADLINIIFRFKKIKILLTLPASVISEIPLVCVGGCHGTWTKSNIEEMAKKSLSVPPMLVTTDALKRLNYLALQLSHTDFRVWVVDCVRGICMELNFPWIKLNWRSMFYPRRIPRSIPRRRVPEFSFNCRWWSVVEWESARLKSILELNFYSRLEKA